jgi:flavodoxin
MSYLVAYYSWSGHTAKVAKALAEQLQGDLEEIRDAKRRKGLLAYFRSAMEAGQKKPAPIEPAVKDVAAYDVVILGCPVWASQMASPMRAYIARERPKLRQIAVFCTMGGSGGDAVLASMASLCGLTPAARLVVADDALRSGAWSKATADFARQVQESANARAGAPA